MGEKIITVNRKARHDYFIDETCEVGILLTGTEIKSIRAGQVNLRDSYAQVIDGEVFLMNAHIAPYRLRGYAQHEPRRRRKLLLHRSEIRRLENRTQTRGYTLVPLRLYLKDGWAKVELAVARGKRQYDKRASIAARQAQQEMERAQKEMGRRLTRG